MGEGVEGEDEIQFLRTVSNFLQSRVRVAQCGCGVQGREFTALDFHEW